MEKDKRMKSYEAQRKCVDEIYNLLKHYLEQYESDRVLWYDTELFMLREVRSKLDQDYKHFLRDEILPEAFEKWKNEKMRE